MLQRIFLLTLLLLLSVLAQEAAPDQADSPGQPDGDLADRPRGERADDELPPPRRQRHGCQPAEISHLPPPSLLFSFFVSQLKRNDKTHPENLIG